MIKMKTKQQTKQLKKQRQDKQNRKLLSYYLLLQEKEN